MTRLSEPTSKLAFTGSAAVDPAQEEENHQRIVDLQPHSHEALAVLYQSLGDPSWRVRKAALAAVERFTADSKLATTLISGLGAQDNAGLRNACAEALVNLGERAVFDLTQALSTADLDQRKFVVEVLGVIGTPQAQHALFAALEQSDSNVRAAVVDALGQIGGPSVVEHLKTRLQTSGDDLQLLVYVLDALARCGAHMSPGELAPLLKHRSLLRFVYPLLGLSHDKAALAPLVDAVAVVSRGARRTAVLALAELIEGLAGQDYKDHLAKLWGGKNAIRDALTQSLDDEDEAVVRAAIRLLGHYGDPKTAPKLLQVAAMRGLVQVALDAAVAMGPQAVPSLMQALDSADVQSQLLYLDVVETLGDPVVVPGLLDLTAVPNAHLAGAAVRVLGRLGDVNVVGPLMELVRRRDEREITRQVVFALGSLGMRYRDEVATQMRRAISQGDVQPGWLSVLGALRRPDDMDVVSAACGHLDPEVRRAALEAAAAYGSRLSETALIAAVSDEHPKVRAAAAKVAAAYASDAVVQALLESLHDLDPWVVAEAARSLGTMQARRSIAQLQLLVSSPVAPIAIAALQSLARLGTSELDGLVRKALQHPDGEVVREALSVAVASPQKPLAVESLKFGLKHRAWDVRWASAEQLLLLRLPVPKQLLEQCLADEGEPLVREKLMRLLLQSDPQ